MRYSAIFVSAVVGLLIAGCASSDQYGARKRKIIVEASPMPASVYVIDNTIWASRGEEILASPKMLQRYYKGESPAEVFLYPQDTVLVARDASGRTGVLHYIASEDNVAVVVPLMPAGHGSTP